MWREPVWARCGVVVWSCIATMAKTRAAKAAPAQAAAKAATRVFTKEQVVHKKLHDNFRSWKLVDTDVRCVNGLTLRQTLARDYDNMLKGKEPKVMGSLYYNRLKECFKPPATTHAGLTVRDASLPIAPALLRAMCAAQRQHPDRSPLSAYLQTAQLPNQSELVGLFRFFVTLKSKCMKQLACSMDAVRYVARLKLHTHFAVEFEAVRAWVDETLEQALARSRANKHTDVVFVSLNRPLLNLIMPSADLDKIVKAKGNLSPLMDEVCRLVASSQTGLKLFAGAVEGILATKLKELIDESISDALAAQGQVSAEALADAQRQCLAVVQAMPCIDMIPRRRCVILQYRCQDIKLRVSSVSEQVQLAFACATKSIGVSSKHLPELWIEDMLIKAGTTGPWKAKLPASLFEAAAAARSRLETAVKDADVVTGDLVSHAMTKAGPDLLVIDPTFRIEMAIVDELVSDATGTRVMNAILACLPEAGKHLEPETSAQKLHAFATSPGFALVDRQAQERVKVVQIVINSLVEQRPPDLSEVLKSTYMQPFVLRLQFFVKDPSGKVGNGIKALHELLAAGTAKSAAGTAVVGDIAPLRTYMWLLENDADRKEKAIALIKDVDDKCNDLGETMRKRRRVVNKILESSTGDVDEAMEKSMGLFR